MGRPCSVLPIGLNSFKTAHPSNTLSKELNIQLTRNKRVHLFYFFRYFFEVDIQEPFWRYS
jgi:hypothetical protein